MAEASWQQARLIPTSGINGAQEQERRATSALLAVMAAVKEYGRSVTKSLGSHAGEIETFIEVEFDLEGKKVIPDGVIRVSRGSKVWTCLLEVKTGRNDLDSQQLENYLDVAKHHGFQALLTISNETPSAAGIHPTRVDKRKLRHVSLHHMAWSEVLSLAVLEKEHRGVADPDQAFILGELIRYLEHPRSGALEFEDMGPSWVSVRNAVADGTLRASNGAAAEVAGRFDALLRYAALQLSTRLGTDASVAYTRREQGDPALRTTAHVASLVDRGILRGSLRIPNTVGNLDVTVDLRARQVICSVDVDAPKEGRPTTKVNWLARQLKSASDKVRVDANVLNQRGGGASELLHKVRETPEVLVLDPSKTIRSFTVALASPMDLKAGRGQGSFIDGMLSAVDSFYGDVLQSLKAWAAKPPRMREQPDAGELAKEQDIAPALVASALSSQDGAEDGPPPRSDGEHETAPGH